MWKYRNTGILAGWNGAVLVIAFLAWLVSFTFLGLPDWTGMREQPLPAFVYVLPDVLAAAVVLTGWLIFRKRVHDDDEYRRNPVEPEWCRLREDSGIVAGMRGSCKIWFFVILLISAVFLLILFFALLDSDFSDTVNRGIFAAGAALMLLLNLRNLLRWQFWRHPPEELEYTEIPVAYSMESKYHVRGGLRKDMSLFFFLPDGRYRVVLHGQNISSQPPESVYFVRLYGIVHWIHWGD